MTKNNFSDKEVKKILKDFGVKSEEELVDVVNNTWNLVTCKKCGRQFDLLTCNYFDGNPVCPKCYGD